jgi:hypothetical protein
MPNLLVLRIYFLLLLSSDGEGKGWNCILYGGFVEDEDDNYGVSNFTGSTTWRSFFPDGATKVEMMSPSWNNFLRSLLRFVMVKSGHDERLGIIIFRSVFLILRWQKKMKENTRKKKFLNSTYMNVGRRSLDICSQAFCRVFAYAVIHTAKRCIGLVLRSGAIYSVGII